MLEERPIQIEFEFDRDVLYRYLRVKSLLQWFVLGLWPMGFIGIPLLMLLMENGMLVLFPEYNKTLVKAVFVMIGLASCFSLLGYVIFERRSAWNLSQSIRLDVDGNFLRLRTLWRGCHTDQKIHFRALIDYEIVDRWFLRCFGLQALKITTASHNTYWVNIIGLKDCEKVRDQLVEFDELRGL